MSSRVRRVVLVTVVALIVLAPGALGRTSPTLGPVTCARYDASFWVEFGAWGGEGTPHHKREQFALAGSRGASEFGGYVIYGSATPSRVARDNSCRPSRLAADPRASDSQGGTPIAGPARTSTSPARAAIGSSARTCTCVRWTP